MEHPIRRHEPRAVSLSIYTPPTYYIPAPRYPPISLRSDGVGDQREARGQYHPIADRQAHNGEGYKSVSTANKRDSGHGGWHCHYQAFRSRHQDHREPRPTKSEVNAAILRLQRYRSGAVSVYMACSPRASCFSLHSCTNVFPPWSSVYD